MRTSTQFFFPLSISLMTHSDIHNPLFPVTSASLWDLLIKILQLTETQKHEARGLLHPWRDRRDAFQRMDHPRIITKNSLRSPTLMSFWSHMTFFQIPEESGQNVHIAVFHAIRVHCCPKMTNPPPPNCTIGYYSSSMTHVFIINSWWGTRFFVFNFTMRIFRFGASQSRIRHGRLQWRPTWHFTLYVIF